MSTNQIETAAAAVDAGRLDALMADLVGYMTGTAIGAAVWLGDELGLYQAMAAGDPRSAAEIADLAGTHPRLTREWLDGQVAARLVDHEPTTDTYRLSPESVAALADDGSPAFVARAMSGLGSIYLDLFKIADAFRGDGKLAWGDHHPCLFTGVEWFFRTGYRAALPGWIDAMDGVAATLRAGGAVADVGCGHGASAVVLAESFPGARVHGFDFHRPSVDIATARAEEAGVADRVTFGVADATSYPGTFDLICFFDCLHDMGDPVGAARHARDHLAPGGSVLLVEPFALDDRRANLTENPMAALLYTASCTMCIPNSLSQEVGLGLGAQAGAARLAEICGEAGLTQVRTVASTPLNLILEVRP